MTHTVVVSESGRGRYEQEISVGSHRMLADEPESLGGGDAGPAPFDFLMTALGTCTAMTLRMYAERKGLQLTRISVTLNHSKLEAEGKPLDRIERQITLEGELSPEQRQRCLEIAERCPVHRALQQPLRIDSRLASN